MDKLKFKVGDLVYYHRKHGVFVSDTIPCEILKVNKKTVNLSDGSDHYRNVRFSNIEKQIIEYPSHINA